MRPVVGADGLAHVFSTLLSVPGFTVYRDIAELRPASTLTVDASGLRLRKFWQLKSAPHEDSLETTWIGRIPDSPERLVSGLR